MRCIVGYGEECAPTAMAQYSLVVLKVPLNANQPSYRPTYTGSDGMCVLHLRSYRPSGAKTYEEGGPIQLWQPVYSALFNSESVCLCLSLTTLSNMSNKLLLIISLKYVKCRMALRYISRSFTSLLKIRTKSRKLHSIVASDCITLFVSTVL